MKKYSKYLALALVMVLIIALCCGCGSSSSSSASSEDKELGTYTIRVGHGGSESHPIHIGCLEMKKYIEEKSGGKLKVEIFPNSQLGGEREMVEAVTNKTLEIAYTTVGPYTSFVPEYMVLDIPFQFTGYEEAWMVLDSTVGQLLVDKGEEYGLTQLAWLESGIRHITTASVPIHSPADLKGLKMRTMEAAMHMKNFEALGSNPTPVAWNELYLAMQQKMVDGEENPIVNIMDLKMYEVQKYITLSAHLYDAAPFVCNTEWWNSLPAEYQLIISNGAKMASSVDRFLTYLQEDAALKVLQDNGMTVIELTDAEREEFRALGQPAVEAAVRKEIGDEFVDKWMSSVSALTSKEVIS